ncbi:hypothetical protein [Flavobacterium sp. HTF]|uniref:hypothetical protein n=1 Tax=Flavobacterium sp. HTF TaxID=2170732 RepID=UPI000D5D6AFE|nr:hypothetical protein [Flavobacterium sp. HTF]PWB21464.1 hypothetical protein DCO46_19830 [Flavobacterium sp. HTF]
MKLKSQVLTFILLCFYTININAQETPLGSKIVGNGDANNYYIGHFTVPGSDGLDIHWYGGIRFGDSASKDVMRIANGKVSIGDVAPTSRLTIKNSSPYSDGGIRYLGYTYPSDVSYWSESQIAMMYNGQFKNFISSIGNSYFNGGNIGIGTTNPTASLEINTPSITGAETLLRLQVSDATQDYLRIGNGTNANAQFLPNLVGHSVSDTRSALYLTASTETTMDTGNAPLMTFDSRTTSAVITTRPLFSWESYGNRKMILNANGSLGIGTTTTGTHKLAVEGSIGAREIKVQATGWSDFVFKKDYKLPTLEEVENHINEKGHLENIPSEEEVLKNGINLGEMNSKLLQKIEELTLYMIEMKKENIKQTQEIDNLKKQLSTKNNNDEN